VPFSTTVVAFRALVKTQHSTVIKCFKCDLGREYTSNKFCELFALDRTIHQISCIDTPKQNGVTKRKHRHIVETAHSLLLFAFIPSEFLGEVVLTAISLINTISSSHSSGFSPFEKLCGYVPDYSPFRVFGYTCFVLRPYVERSKLSSRSTICVFLSYDEGKKGYRCFDPITQKLYVSCYVVFLEHIPFFSILSTTHSLTRPGISHIDPFSKDSDSLSSHVPSTLDTLSHVQPICTNHCAGTDTLFLSTTPQASSKIVDPPLCQSICFCISIKLLEFAYSCYSSSFTSFLASVHCLSKPSSYKKAILDPFFTTRYR